MSKRRYVILAEGVFADPFYAKTAHGVVRYSNDDIVAVVDSTLAGRDVADILPKTGKRAPIVAHVGEALQFEPTSLLLGSAPFGGAIPPAFRAEIVTAIDAGLEIVNGLHDQLRGDAEFVRRAAASGARLWDVREPPKSIPLFSGAAASVPQAVVLAVGSDCAVGKMSAMLEVRAAADAAKGPQAAFVATGQTGIMIAGGGIAVDRVISDFVTGSAEQLVLGVPPSTAVTLVEGQGSIIHPAYAPVTFGLLYGAAPDLLVLCHRAGQTHIAQYDVEIPPLRELIELHERIVRYVKPARTVAIALNTSSLSDAEARAAIASAEDETGLPADDAVRFGGAKLWDAIAAAAATTRKHAPQPAGSAR